MPSNIFEILSFKKYMPYKTLVLGREQKDHIDE